MPCILRGLGAIECICQASIWKIIEEMLKYKWCIIRLQKDTYSTKVNLRDLLNEPLSRVHFTCATLKMSYNNS